MRVRINRYSYTDADGARRQVGRVITNPYPAVTWSGHRGWQGWSSSALQQNKWIECEIDDADWRYLLRFHGRKVTHDCYDFSWDALEPAMTVFDRWDYGEKRINPMFRFYGSKYRLAKHIGPPRRSLVVEPFAGSAGYSTYWGVEKAILVEKDRRLVDVWRMLCEGSEGSMMTLPADVESREEMKTAYGLPDCVCDFIGLWFRYSASGPRPTRHPTDPHLWSAKIRNRVAKQVHRLRNWEVYHADEIDLDDIGDAHWHIDPPYQHQGKHYRFSDINYNELAEWVRRREGCGEVCEAAPADWLPFEPLRTVPNQKGRPYSELIWRF